MAKIIRFPLQMKDGTAVRTLEELQEHFDLESVLGYFADGKLKTWLANQYYEVLAEKVAALSSDTPDLNAKLCEIFGVEYSADADDTDFETLQRRNEKLRILREITTDQSILDNVDAVAFNQDELFDILDEAPAIIYLYGAKFSIPYAKGNITYIGVNNPEVSLEKNELEYKKNGILLQRIRFANKSYAISIEVVKELIDQERYDEALPIVKQLAVEGDVDAQGYLGWMHLKGCGVEKNDAFAVEWLRKAAEQGNSKAQFNLAYMYEEGRGVKKDGSQAVIWYRKAAEQGDVQAQHNLGLMYKNGNGVSKDMTKAVEWLRKSAEQGTPKSQFVLAMMYKKGKDIEQNYAEALKWLNKAALQGNDKAQCILGYMYLTGDGVEEDMKAAAEWFRKAADQGNARAQCELGLISYDLTNGKGDFHIAFELFQKSAEQGYAEAQYKLGEMYSWRHDESRDDAKAFEWFEKAADQGYAEAQRELGDMYYYGTYVDKDVKTAVKWYEKAAEQGDVHAQILLYEIFSKGQDVPQDWKVAFKWLRKVAEKGVGNTEAILGDMYYSGRGVAVDKEEAFKWVRKAAKRGIVEAQYNLGIMYRNGEGVAQDMGIAVEWFQKAAQQGYAEAQEALTELVKDLHDNETKIDEQKSITSENIDKEITHIVDKYIHQIPNNCAAYDSVEILYESQKVRNALNKFGMKASGTIIGLVDSSLFSNGKDGILFTTKGMAFDNAFEKIFVRYDEINQIQFGKKNKSIFLVGRFSGTKSPDDTIPEIGSVFFDVYVIKSMLEEICNAL
ncbi:MAG: sel1 repeat family protein [Oscillospiraceae bacterium]|nr:sel1 repeat family protein [Oscillospiraceae bacterium]